MSALPNPVESQTFGHLTMLPAVPPRELSAAIDAAAERAAALGAAGRELNFVVDAAGALRVEVRDLDGTVLEVVDPARAMRVMTGLGEI